MVETLKGLKVLDFSLAAAGPFVTRLLGSCGAQVTLVEPLEGSHSRVLQTFDYVCGGKRSLPLNAKSEEGQEVLHRLIKECDVFVSNYRPKALKKLGLTYEDVSAINPRMIYATLTGMGEEGAEAGRPGWDATTFYGRGAFLGTFFNGDNPANLADQQGDISTGLALWGGVCAALAYRERTGKGLRVYNSLLQTALFLSNTAISQSQFGFHYPESHAAPARAMRNTYRSSDGQWFVISVPSVTDFNRIMSYVGRQDVIDSGRFQTLADLLYENAPAGVVIFEEIFGNMTFAEIQKMFLDLDLSMEKVFMPGDTLNDPQNLANDHFFEVYNTAKKKTVLMPALPPIKFGDKAVNPNPPAPRLGEHSVEVLKELNFTEKEIAAMLEKGITIDGSK